MNTATAAFCEISEQNKSLMSTAKKAGVGDYGLFHDAGYMGMYRDYSELNIQGWGGLIS